MTTERTDPATTDEVITIDITGNARDQHRFERYLADEGLDVVITTRMLESRGAEQIVGNTVYAISISAAGSALFAGVTRAIAKLRKESPGVQVVGPDDLLPHRHDANDKEG